MKKYRSHKVVEAAPILGYTENGVIVGVDDEVVAHMLVPADFNARGTPDVGDYLVRYQPDGYLSWSPKKAFEDGYTEIEPETWQARLQKEATDLDAKINKLRKYLMSGPAIEAQALNLLRHQYAAMNAYADIFDARLRREGVIGTETPPTVRG